MSGMSALRLSSDDAEWRSGQPYRHALSGKEGNYWRRTRTLMEDGDEERMDAWKDEIGNLLIVASLLSAVTASFAVETQKDLQGDPEKVTTFLLAKLVQAQLPNESLPNIDMIQGPPEPGTSDRATNGLLFISLAFSLAVVTLGLLCLQWIREYSRNLGSLAPETYFQVRLIRDTSFKKWRIEGIVSLLPFLLQLALVSFFGGLVVFLFGADHSVAIPTCIILGITFAFLVVTTLLPILHAYSGRLFKRFHPPPFRSPQAWFFLNKDHWTELDKTWLKTGGELAQTAYDHCLRPLLTEFGNTIDNAIDIYLAASDTSITQQLAAVTNTAPSTADETPTIQTLADGASDVEALPLVPLPSSAISPGAAKPEDKDLARWKVLDRLCQSTTGLVSKEQVVHHRIELFVRLTNQDCITAPEISSLGIPFGYVPLGVGPFFKEAHSSMSNEELRHSLVSADVRKQLFRILCRTQVINRAWENYLVHRFPAKNAIDILWEIGASFVVQPGRTLEQDLRPFFDEMNNKIITNANPPTLQPGAGVGGLHSPVHFAELARSAERLFIPLLIRLDDSARASVVQIQSFKQCFNALYNALCSGGSHSRAASTTSLRRTISANGNLVEEGAALKRLRGMYSIGPAPTYTWSRRN